MSNSTSNSWDENAPQQGDDVGDGATEIRLLRASVRSRIQKEHVTPGDGGVGGEHRAGSGLTYISATDPTLRPDGTTSLSASDYGRLNLKITGGIYDLIAFTSLGWISLFLHFTSLAKTFLGVITFALTPVWQKGIVGNNIAVSGRNYLDSANVEIAKINTSNVPILGTGIQTASESAPTLNAQVANKKYVDDSISSGSGFFKFVMADVPGVSPGPYNTWVSLDLSAIGTPSLGGNRGLVLLKIKDTAESAFYEFRDGDAGENIGSSASDAGGTSAVRVDNGRIGYIMVPTNGAGIVKWKVSKEDATCVITLMGYIK